MIFNNELTDKDIQEVKHTYYIPEGDKPLYKQDFDFVIKYMREVYNVVESFWEAESTKSESDYETAVANAMSLAGGLEEYMKSAQAGNVMRRLIFIKNIDSEINAAQVAVPWLARKYPIEISKKTEPIVKSLALFYKYICANALMENNFLEKKEREAAEIMAERLKATVETDFTKRIDGRNPCFSDIYYLMGHYKKAIDAKRAEEKTLEADKCEGCKLDDCLSSHCFTMSRKIELSSEVKKLDTALKACITKALSGEILPYTRLAILRDTKDGSFKQLVSRVLDMDLSSASLKKRIVVDWGRERNICIQPSKVQDVLADSISTLSGVDYWTTGDISSGIVLNDYDLSW